MEPAAFAVGLSTALRRGGVPVAPDRAGALAAALRLVPPWSRSALYWTCRVTLVSDVAQLARFDAVFSAVFDGLLDPADARGDPNAPPAVGSEPRTRLAPPDARPAEERPAAPSAGPTLSTPDADDATGRASAGREAVLVAAAPDERLHEVAFAELTDDELVEVRRLVARIRLTTPTRLSRRTRVSRRRSDPLDLRRTVRTARRDGGEPVRLLRERRRPEPRRLVLLCDVSASMEPYTRAFLTLLQGAVAEADAEAFVFATGLTRLTRQLARGSPDVALAHAAAASREWASGTRLAEGLRRLLDEHGRRGLARGAVVVVLSDGWSQDDPELVDRQMARLRRLAARIVWVNPRKAAPGYVPLAGAMAAALSYCDAFVSGHSLAAMEELVQAVAGG